MVVSPQSSSTGDASVLAATGRSRDDWRETLTAVGASDWSHNAIATWLVTGNGVDPWWAQNITVDFEQHVGRRRPGQRADGSFEVSASRRLAGEQADALAAVVASVTAGLGREPTSVNTGVRYLSARWKLDDGTAVAASVPPSSGGKSTVQLSFVGLASEEAMPAAKEFLRNVLPPALR